MYAVCDRGPNVGAADRFVRECRMSTNKWSRDIVVREIERLCDEGADLRHSEVSRNHHRLVSAAIRYFGSWGEAVSASGIDYLRIRMESQHARSGKVTKWGLETIARGITKLIESGETLAAATVRRDHPALFSAAVSPRYYGSWRGALTAVGVDYDKILSGSRSRSSRSGDQRGMRMILRKLAVLPDSIKWLSADEVRSKYPRLVEKAETYFGSWEAAAIVAITRGQKPRNP